MTGLAASFPEKLASFTPAGRVSPPLVVRGYPANLRRAATGGAWDVMAAAVFARGHSDEAAEDTAEGNGIEVANVLRDVVGGARTGGEQFLRFFHALELEIRHWRKTRGLLEPALVGAARELRGLLCFHQHVLRGEPPLQDFLRATHRGVVVPELGTQAGKGALAVRVPLEQEDARHLLRASQTGKASHEIEHEVLPRSAAARGHDPMPRSRIHEDLLRGERHTGKIARKIRGVGPVRGGFKTIEQARRGEDVGAGAA